MTSIQLAIQELVPSQFQPTLRLSAAVLFECVPCFFVVLHQNHEVLQQPGGASQKQNKSTYADYLRYVG